MKAPTQALVAVATWTGALLLLAVLWVRSPFTGPGPMFVAWSAPVALLLVLTVAWLNRLEVRQVPRRPALLAGVAAVWLAAGWLAVTGLGSELALDGEILRDEGRRALGTVLEWIPAGFGLLLSVAGLIAALEARYRIAHGEAGAPPERAA